MVDLEQEMRGPLMARHFAALGRLGVQPTSIGKLGALQSGASVAVGAIEAQTGGFYQPMPNGVSALLIAACGPCDGAAHPIVDIIATRSSEQARWWWRTGQASMLGEAMVENDIGEPVPVVATPIEWLAASGQAVCVLDWSSASPVWQKLRHGPSLSFSDDRLRNKVRNSLVLTAPLPVMELAA